MAKQIIVAPFVTETQAKAVLAEIRPWLRHRPRIAQFREQLDPTVEIAWAIHRAAGHYLAIDKEFRQIRRCVERLKTELRAVEEISTAPKMANFSDLLKLNDTRTALVEVERDLSLTVFSGRGEPPKGPAPRNWYFGFVRDLAGIARGLGIELTIGGGGRTDDPHATLFTRFVWAVEKLLPRELRSNSLTACAKQIERANKASDHEFGLERAFIAHARKGERAFKAYAREIRRK